MPPRRRRDERWEDAAQERTRAAAEAARRDELQRYLYRVMAGEYAKIEASWRAYLREIPH